MTDDPSKPSQHEGGRYARWANLTVRETHGGRVSPQTAFAILIVTVVLPFGIFMLVSHLVHGHWW